MGGIHSPQSFAAYPGQHDAERPSGKGGEFAYRIIVDHPAQLQAFELSMPKLLEYLRDALQNDLLTIKVEVNSSPVENKQLPQRNSFDKSSRIIQPWPTS